MLLKIIIHMTDNKHNTVLYTIMKRSYNFYTNFLAMLYIQITHSLLSVSQEMGCLHLLI